MVNAALERKMRRPRSGGHKIGELFDGTVLERTVFCATAESVNNRALKLFRFARVKKKIGLAIKNRRTRHYCFRF